MFSLNDLLVTSAIFASAVCAGTVFTISGVATVTIAGTFSIFHNFLLIKY